MKQIAAYRMKNAHKKHILAVMNPYQETVSFMRKTLTILYVSLVCTPGMLAQSPQETDSLQAQLKSATGDKKALILLELSRPHLADSSGFAYVEDAFQAAQTDSVRGKALYFKSFVHKNLGDLASQIRELKQALNLLQNNEPLIRYSALGQLAGSYEHRGLYAEALETALERLALSETLPAKENLIEALVEVGYTYDRMGEYHNAIAWYRRAMPIADELDNDFWKGNIYGMTGIAYDELQEYTSALENNFKAVELFKKAGEYGYARTWYSNIGNTYTKTGDLQNAEKYTLEALSDPTETWRVVTLVNLGKIYLEQGRFADAQKTLDSALVASQERGSKRILSEAYYHLHELRVKQNNFKEALAFYEKHKTNEDEMLNEAKARQINELSVQYETHEKEKQLLEQKAILAQQELKIRKKNTAIYSTTALVLVSVALSFFVYRQQKLKNLQLVKDAQLADAHSQIMAQKKLNDQRLHIARELHDNIGTYLTFMKTSLEKWQDYNGNGRVKEVVQLMKKTATELRHTVWILNNESITLEEIILRIRDLMQFNQQDVSLSADVIGNDQLVLDNIQSTHLIRVIQEAINNALKHSGATQVDVLLYGNEHDISFEVRDNGTGFQQSAEGDGNGIVNMHYRMNKLGGTLQVKSNAETGTMIRGMFHLISNSLTEA